VKDKARIEFRAFCQAISDHHLCRVIEEQRKQAKRMASMGRSTGECYFLQWAEIAIAEAVRRGLNVEQAA
jgi:bacterioferritin-associated ferredoxin